MDISGFPTEASPLGAATALFDPIAAARIAQSLTGDASVEVVLGDYHPSTNLVTGQIMLPDLRALAGEDRQRAAFFLRGCLYHEAAHLVFTREDMHVQGAVHGKAPAPGVSEAADLAFEAWRRWGGMFEELATVIEDVRIDQRMMFCRPGLKRFMPLFLRHVMEVGGDPREQIDKQPPFMQIRNVLLLVGRGVHPVATLPVGARMLVELLGQAFDAAVGTRTCMDVVTSAAAILAALDAAALSAASVSGFDATSPEFRALDAVTAPCEARDACLHADEHLDRILDDLLAKARVASTVEDGAEPSEIGDRSDNEDERPKDRYLVLETKYDEIVRFSAAERVGHRGDFYEVCREARAASGTLVRDLSSMLAARANGNRSWGRPSGYRIDPVMLPTIVLGTADNRVWLDDDACRLSAAVMVLIDCSGSMCCDTKVYKARVCAAALHMALEPAGVPHAVAGFTTAPTPRELVDEIARRRAGGEDLSRYTRLDVVTRTYVFKDFDERDASAIARIEGEDQNLDGEAVRWAADRLLRRPEKQRILFVLSDGEPSGGSHAPTEAQHLRDMIARAMKSGVAVVGIGIASEAVRAFYPKHVVVDSPADLSHRLLRLVKHELLA